jgi:hypothetical protein
VSSHRADRATAFRELRLLLTGRPAESQPWREYWILWLPTFGLMVVVSAILDRPLLSWAGPAVLVGGLAFGFVLSLVLRRLGIIGRDA